ncbi:MAG: DMT family transporter [Verrucomicrobiota bacterium]
MSTTATSAHSGRQLMLLSAASYIANVLIIRALGRAGTDVWIISGLRFAAGLALCFLFYHRTLDLPALFTKPRLMFRGLIGGASTYGFYLTIVRLGAGRAVFLNNTYVILSALLAVLLLAEPFRRPLVLGAGTALLGLGLLTGAIFGLLRLGLYDGVALLVALASAWVVVAIRQLHREGVGTATIFASQCVYGLLLCVPFVLLNHPVLPGPGGCVGLMVAGLCAGAGQLAMTAAYRHLPVAEGALIQTLVPLGIAGGGLLFFGEQLGRTDLVGGLLIVAGSVVPMLRPAPPAR